MVEEEEEGGKSKCEFFCIFNSPVFPFTNLCDTIFIEGLAMENGIF